MMGDEVNQVVGWKSKHNAKRQAVRHSSAKRSVVPEGRKTLIEWLQARTRGGQEYGCKHMRPSAIPGWSTRLS